MIVTPTFYGSAETQLMLHATTATVQSQVLRVERAVAEEFYGHVVRASAHCTGHRPGYHANGTMRLSFRLADGRLIRLGLYVHPIAPAEPIAFEDFSAYIRWIGHKRLLELTPSDR